METKQFKTNIMCGSCIAKVTPVLDEVFGEKNWNVNTGVPEKILTISTAPDNDSNVLLLLGKLGFKAESLN